MPPQITFSIGVLRRPWQTKIHNIGATVVGVDKFGNKYYEKLRDTQYGCCYKHCNGCTHKDLYLGISLSYMREHMPFNLYIL
ncbi:hypothetical protein ACS0TY_018380 [Phlomoides rotata]